MPTQIPGYSYNLAHPIGYGTFSLVVGGENRDTGSPVAVKISHPRQQNPSAYESVQKESDFFKKVIGIPHTLQMRTNFHIAETGDERWAIIFNRIPSSNMPLDPPLNLYDLSRRRPLSWGQVVTCGKQLVECLIELKKRKLVHTDFKPANMIFNPDSNSLTLIDFGNGCDREELKNNNHQTTFPYRAPEMFLSHERTDFETDMWSMGVSLFQLYTHSLPFPYREVPYSHNPAVRCRNTAKQERDVLHGILSSLGPPSASYQGLCQYHQQKKDGYTSPCNWREKIIQKELMYPFENRGHPDRLISFLEKIFQYENRLTPEAAISDPLFAEDLHIILHCTMPEPMQKKYFLKIDQLEIPLTSSCVHLPLKEDKNYSAEIVDVAGKCWWAFQTILCSGSYLPLYANEIHLPEEDTENDEIKNILDSHHYLQ